MEHLDGGASSRMRVNAVKTLRLDLAAAAAGMAAAALSCECKCLAGLFVKCRQRMSRASETRALACSCPTHDGQVVTPQFLLD